MCAGMNRNANTSAINATAILIQSAYPMTAKALNSPTMMRPYKPAATTR